MSHYSRVKTQFRHREALISCLNNLGYEVETDTVLHNGDQVALSPVTGAM